ncbi:NfeD family protein [Arthrobacter jiangjiafuii]|uniref:NfeD family protein n=1 Tax=Arthrobacter jiangjiafuii TaxID=2817475 RepID=A0A975M3B2_9MICC|nr:NfeD family protein [Arthrobacter jiangjiafuii]MBP3043124.1 NfeD family protein [Arthrobacter jiangjiafuii]QWC08681.1 NfeD family protein [Arthrobacter jiangjiafuii]
MQDVYQWLLDYGWAVWLVLFLALAAIETLTLDLFFAMLSVGALGAMLAAILGAPLFLQVLVFCIVALLMIVLVRPVALKHLERGPRDQRSNIDRLIGAPALTLEAVSGTAGTVKLGGEVWTARTPDGSSLIAGEPVLVTRIDGATAVVVPAPSGAHQHDTKPDEHGSGAR